MAFEAGSSEATEVASGARLIVDVEAGRGRTLYALSQGIWDGVQEGSPAFPNTGSLVQVDGNRGFEVIIYGLDRPTSMEFIQNSASTTSANPARPDQPETTAHTHLNYIPDLHRPRSSRSPADIDSKYASTYHILNRELWEFFHKRQLVHIIE